MVHAEPTQRPLLQFAQKKVYSHQAAEYSPYRGVKDMTPVNQSSNPIAHPVLRLLLLMLLAGGLSGCATLSQEKRAELDALAEKNLQSMTASHPGLQEKLEESKGYLALDAWHWMPDW